MKTIITAWDIENARANCKKEIVVEDAIITEMAKDLAEKLNIKIITKGFDEKLTNKYYDSEKSFDEQSRYTYKDLKITEEIALKWKEEFPILKDIIHVGNCSQGPQAKRVRKAIENYLDNWLTVGMDWDYWVQETIKAKEEFAKLINAEPSEIAISTSVSEATASVASALNPHINKKKIVTTEADFPTIGHIWLAHQKYGYKVEFVPVRNGEIDINDYEKYIDNDTILTSITHVYYQNGF
ncbi:MAG: aminotransferase class V-fold PLP-dependent enzyme, partial [Candidatus Pelagibacter ubique]